MPIKKAAWKALRQTKRHAIRNLAIKKRLREAMKAAEKISDKTKAKEVFQKLQQTVDKSMKHRIIKRNTASRMKSRVMARLKKAGLV